MTACRYWDSCLFLAWLKQRPDHLPQCNAGLQKARAGELVIVTSALTIAEVLFLVRGEIPVSADTRAQIRGFFENEFIVVRELDRRIAERAQDVIWDFQVDHKDAVHVATALTVRETSLGLEQLDTFDSDLAGLSGKLDGLPIGPPNFQLDLMSDAIAREPAPGSA